MVFGSIIRYVVRCKNSKTNANKGNTSRIRQILVKSLKYQQGFFAGLLAAAPLIGAGLSFLGGERANAAQAAQANQANAFSGAQTQAQMDFQERMSNTAHQREAKDLKKAGLNRILTVTRGGGASTPAGASAIGQQADIKDTLSPAVSNATQIAGASAQIDLATAQAEKTRAETANIKQIQKPLKNVGDIAEQANRVISYIGEAIEPADLKFLADQLPKDGKKALNWAIKTTKGSALGKKVKTIINKFKTFIENTDKHLGAIETKIKKRGDQLHPDLLRSR